MSAEMFAIYMALEWFVGQEEDGGVIFTDSLSSISCLRHGSVKSNTIYKSMIHKVIQNLNDTGRSCHICWVPSHRGIKGNEEADAAAKAAADEPFLTIPHFSTLDVKTMIKKVLILQWESRWIAQRSTTNASMRFAQIKQKLQLWPWASVPDNRMLETVMMRLRSGHCGLAAHMFRIGFKFSPLCQCGVPETVVHYLLQCPNHSNHRLTMQRALAALNVPCTLINLLGGGDLDLCIQLMVVRIVGQFLHATDKLGVV
jgi:ribonuclease HI